MKTPTVVLGVCGSIACYKAAEIASQLTRSEVRVRTVMTRHATEFVTPLTFQTLTRERVTVGIFDEKESWHPGHIEIADSADLFLVAPATANALAKLAHGIADDALSSIALATPAPVWLAPAMNGKMWLHPATRDNADRLASRGVRFLGPASGELACGYHGTGRLLEPEAIVAEVLGFFQRP